MAESAGPAATEFSLLLPVYRRDDPDHFRRALASATVEQELAPTQAVIVVDGPIKGALEAEVDGIGERLGETSVTVVRLPRNVGLAEALEAGLEACEHDIVARADADDVSLPGRFAAQVPLVAEGLDLVGSAIVEFVDDEDERGIVRTPPLSQDEITAYARFHDPFNHPSVVYRRSAVQRAGGYRHLERMEDYWLFARMIAGGARVANLAEPLVLYRVGAGSYARRGGMDLLRSEVRLQRRLRAEGFTTRTQYARNVVVRGGYRLVPEAVRRRAYRRLIAPRPGKVARG